MICEKCRKLVRDYKADYCICFDCYTDYKSEFVQVKREDLITWHIVVNNRIHDEKTILKGIQEEMKKYLGEKGG